MRTPAPSRVVELRDPLHGPAPLTAPEPEILELPIKNLLARKVELVLQLQHLAATPNKDAGSTSVDSMLNVGDKLEDIVLRKIDVVGEKDQLLILQQWEGFATDIGSNSFSANLIDLTAGDTDPSEEVELPLSDLSKDDRRILHQGAVFRWLIGYRISPRGTRQRFSFIFFRRMAALTDDQMSETRREARTLAASIRWD
jgi:hypothetical protein